MSDSFGRERSVDVRRLSERRRGTSAVSRGRGCLQHHQRRGTISIRPQRSTDTSPDLHRSSWFRCVPSPPSGRPHASARCPNRTSPRREVVALGRIIALKKNENSAESEIEVLRRDVDAGSRCRAGRGVTTPASVGRRFLSPHVTAGGCTYCHADRIPRPRPAASARPISGTSLLRSLSDHLDRFGPNSVGYTIGLGEPVPLVEPDSRVVSSGRQHDGWDRRPIGFRQ
jgi:hypothetical protein